MTRTANRELRKELLLKALDKFTDLDKAFEAVVRMERFILEGDEAIEAPVAQGKNATESAAGKDPLETLDVDQGTDVDQGAKDEDCRIRRSTSHKRWHRHDDVSLRELWSKDLTVKEIATKLERTPASIYGRIHHLGLSPRKARSNKVLRSGGTKNHLENGTAKRAGELAGGNDEALPEKEFREFNGPVVIEEVIRFLRTRDYSIISTDDGRYKVDGRHIMTAQELLQRANRVRESLGHSRWNSLSRPPYQDRSVPAEKGPG